MSDSTPADNGTFFQRHLLPSLALLDHYLGLPFNDWPAKWDHLVKDRLAGGKAALAQVKEETADVGPSLPPERYPTKSCRGGRALQSRLCAWSIAACKIPWDWSKFLSGFVTGLAAHARQICFPTQVQHSRGSRGEAVDGKPRQIVA
tara:strand:- start:141 stop:581 length:441 start_codon:yes stop_codon:yes gene_type:complete